MPERPEQHITDEEAKSFFRTTIPSKWVTNEQKSDYGKDYTLEVFKNNRPAGHEVYIQLKGTRHLLERKDYISFSLEVDHLKYYLAKVQLPVFLVVVDVIAKKAYFCFLQQYVLDHLERGDWRTKATVNIKISYGNELNNSSFLLKAIESATAFMTAHKVRLEQWRLEEKDPRFSVKLNVTEKGTRAQISAKETTQLTLTIKLKKEHAEMKIDLFLRGQPLELSPEETIVVGSPLFDDGRIAKIKFSHSRSGTMALTANDINGREVATVFPIEGKISGGPREMRFTGTVAGTPLNLAMRVDFVKRAIKIQLSFDLSVWVNQPVLLLPHFEDLYRVFVATDNGATLQLRGVQGTHTFTVATLAHGSDIIRHANFLLTALHKARVIARHFGIQPILPSDLSIDDIRPVEKLYTILDKKEHKAYLKNCNIGFSVEKSTAENILKEMDKYPDGEMPEGKLDTSDPVPFQVLGTTVQLPVKEYALTGIKLTTKRTEIERQIQSKAETVRLNYEGAQAEELIRI